VCSSDLYFFDGVEKGVACQQPEELITAADPQSVNRH
jgi:hypothetical protein